MDCSKELKRSLDYCHISDCIGSLILLLWPYYWSRRFSSSGIICCYSIGPIWCGPLWACSEFCYKGVSVVASACGLVNVCTGGAKPFLIDVRPFVRSSGWNRGQTRVYSFMNDFIIYSAFDRLLVRVICITQFNWKFVHTNFSYNSITNYVVCWNLDAWALISTNARFLVIELE